MYILPIGLSQFKLEKLRAFDKTLVFILNIFQHEEKTKAILTLESDTSYPISEMRCLDHMYNVYIYSSMVFQFLFINLFVCFYFLGFSVHYCGIMVLCI